MGDKTRCGRPTGQNNELCERLPDHAGDCTPVIWDADDMDGLDAARAKGYAAGVEAAVQALTEWDRTMYEDEYRHHEAITEGIAAIRAATRGKT